MRRLSFVLLVLVSATLELRAELPRWVRSVIQWVDSADIKGCDRTYVRLAEPGFLAYVDTHLAGNGARVRMPHSAAAPELQGRLLTVPSVLMSVGVSYRGWGLDYSRDFSRYGDTEFNCTFHSSRYGLEYRCHNAYSMHGTLQPVSGPMLVDIEGLMGRLRTSQFNAYWVFNQERFSLPAATIHTTIQLRSSGSWLAMFNYWHGSYRNRQNEDIPDAFRRISLSHLNLGAGYAYNYVFAHQHCLLHGLIAPMLTIWHRNRLYRFGAQGTSLRQQLSGDAIAHLHFTYNQGRYVMGVQSAASYSIMPCSDGFSANVVDWLCRGFVGVRF